MVWSDRHQNLFRALSLIKPLCEYKLVSTSKLLFSHVKRE